MVQYFADENELEFKPKFKRHEDLEVYGLGTVNIVIDQKGNAIRASFPRERKWKAMSLEDIFQEHLKRLRQGL